MAQLSAFIGTMRRTVAATPSRDLARAAGIGFALATLFTVAAFVGSEWRVSSKEKTSLTRMSERQSDDDLTTGSIVFVPTTGDTCRESEIDNATWEIREIGEIPCRQALADRNDHGTAMSTSTRLDIIRESFRKSDH